MKAKELARLRAKFVSSPPYDWEDDVESCLDAILWYSVQLAIAQDALMRIRTLAEQAIGSEASQIVNLVRSAQVKIQGER